MLADRGNGSSQQRAIELLAQEWQLPVSEVARLYEQARAELEMGARVRTFLEIFAIRNVRRLLRQRGRERPKAA